MTAFRYTLWPSLVSCTRFARRLSIFKVAHYPPIRVVAILHCDVLSVEFFLCSELGLHFQSRPLPSLALCEQLKAARLRGHDEPDP